MPTTVAVRRVHAARPTPTVKVGTVVQAAVDARFIVDTPASRADYARTVAANASKAVVELVGYRKIRAASDQPGLAPLPAGREPGTRPAPAQPSQAPQYPSSWARPASQQRPDGVRRATATKAPVDRVALPSGFRTRARAARSSAVRAAQTVSAPSDTRAYLAAQAKVAADNQAQAQRGIHTYTDRHTLIAAASGPARAQQAAERAELERRAAAHAARYGR